MQEEIEGEAARLSSEWHKREGCFAGEMTLRDWFAGQALPQAMVGNSLFAAAERAYRIADAMIKARGDGND